MPTVSEALLAAVRALPRLPNTVDPWRDDNPDDAGCPPGFGDTVAACFDAGQRAELGARQKIDSAEVGAEVGAAEQRCRRLRAHGAADTIRLVLIGEAAGYQGCRISGIPFTSESLLMAGAIPRIAPTLRLSSRQRPWSEPSARVVWRALHAHALAGETFLWNALPLHPHRPGEPFSNRTPSRIELTAGLQVLEVLRAALPGVLVAAVGNNAAASLQRLGWQHATLRHPAYGGVAAFEAGVATLAAQLQTKIQNKPQVKLKTKLLARPKPTHPEQP